MIENLEEHLKRLGNSEEYISEHLHYHEGCISALEFFKHNSPEYCCKSLLELLCITSFSEFDRGYIKTLARLL